MAAQEPKKLRVLFNCNKCPAYCCSYDRIAINKRDVKRIAKHFGLTPEEAQRKYTKVAGGEMVMRQHKDHIYKHVCQFLDQEERGCTIYDARPEVCRGYPYSIRCGYYDFLACERRHQDDETFIPDA